MAYQVGSLIKDLRTRKGIKQEELAYGIMDRTALSKIERGLAMPSKTNLDTLLERLGYTPHLTAEILMTAEEVEIQKMKNNLQAYVSQLRFEEADILIERLEQNKNFHINKLNKQWLLHMKAGNEMQKGKAEEENYDLIIEALRLTLPNFSEDKIKNYHLSVQEIRLLIALAHFHYINSNLDNAIAINFQLKMYFDNRVFDVFKKGQYFPQVLSNLASFLCDAKRFDEVLDITNYGIQICKETSWFYFLPDLSWSKAESLFELGQLEESRAMVKDIYHTYSLFERHYEKKLFKKYAEETLGVQF